MIIDQHELRIFSGAAELEPLENAGTITADRGWSPHVQGNLTVRAPDDLSLTDPGEMITIELVQRFGDIAVVRDLTELWSGPGRTLANLTAEITGAGRTLADLTAELITATSWNTPVRAATGRTFHLVIAQRTRTRDEHALQLVSLEATVQDWVWWGPSTPVIEASTTREMLASIIAAYSTVTSTNFPADIFLMRETPVRLALETLTLDRGTATIAALDPLNTASRHRLYSPGEPMVILDDKDRVEPTSITVELGVNLIDWRIVEDRNKPLMMRFTGDVPNPTTPVYKSQYAFPELNPPHERYIAANHIYRSTGLFSGVDSALRGYLAREGLDESPVQLTTINDYSVMPGSPITYTLPDETPVEDSIDAITWQLGGRWEMDIWV